MKLYIDSAVVAEVVEINSWGVLSGVTTNPSLIVKSGEDFQQTIVRICEEVGGPVSAEVTTEDSASMIAQGREFAGWNSNVVVKLPTNQEGLKACSVLSKENIKTNLTLCFSINQALLCARAGATYVSPFIGRLDDIGYNGIELIEGIKDVFLCHDIKTQIIAASIRTPQHISQAAAAGADIATIPYPLFAQMLKNPLTDIGLEKFMNDWQQSKLS